MFERDYILRIIQQFARMIAHIIGLKEQGKYDEALEEIKDAYGNTLKLNYDEVVGYNEKEWDEFLRTHSHQEWEMVSDLLRLEGEILVEMNRRDGSCFRLYKALDLLHYVEEADKTYSLDRKQKIAGIEDTLSGMNNK